MELILGRPRNLMATVADQDTCDVLEDTMALIEMNQHRLRIVPEARLSSVANTSCKCLCWDLSGRVFLSHRIVITDSERKNVFAAVLFSVDKNLLDGEPGVWRKLNAAWEAKFGLVPGKLPGQPSRTNMGRPARWFPSTRGILR